MAKKVKLTPAEWEIMNAVWQLNKECSVRDVLEYLYPNGEKAYTTIQAFMNILERKGVLHRKKVGLVNFYFPTRSKDKVAKAEMSSVLSRVFGGSVTAFASSLMSLENVSLEEIQHIKDVLKKKEKELQGKRNE
jgi:predicted transcriptional regulator